MTRQLSFPECSHAGLMDLAAQLRCAKSKVFDLEDKIRLNLTPRVIADHMLTIHPNGGNFSVREVDWHCITK